MLYKKTFAFIFLFAIIFTCYSNTYEASWHLDDYMNIVENPGLHLNEFSLDSVKKTFFASVDGGLYQEKKLYRPVPCFTFAVNWYFGKDNVAGYHLVNNIIHFLTSYLLFLTVYNS